ARDTRRARRGIRLCVESIGTDGPERLRNEKGRPGKRPLQQWTAAKPPQIATSPTASACITRDRAPRCYISATAAFESTRERGCAGECRALASLILFADNAGGEAASGVCRRLQPGMCRLAAISPYAPRRATHPLRRRPRFALCRPLSPPCLRL